MHWVWASEPTADDEAKIYGPQAWARPGVEFETGFVVPAKLPGTELLRDRHSQGVLADNIHLSGSGGLLFSSRLRQLLAAVGVDNVQYCETVIRNSVDGSETSDYCIANIVGRVGCLDRQQSVMEMSPDDQDVIELIDLLVIDEARTNGFDLFRLAEQPEIVVASARVKEACERQRITGIRFYDPRDYQP